MFGWHLAQIESWKYSRNWKIYTWKSVIPFEFAYLQRGGGVQLTDMPPAIHCLCIRMHVLSLYYLNFSQKQPVIVLFMYAKRERYWWFRSASLPLSTSKKTGNCTLQVVLVVTNSSPCCQWFWCKNLLVVTRCSLYPSLLQTGLTNVIITAIFSILSLICLWLHYPRQPWSGSRGIHIKSLVAGLNKIG